MGDSDGFANNPFQILADKVLPAKSGGTKIRSRHSDPTAKAQQGEAIPTSRHLQVSQEDRDMFLGNLSKLCTKKEKQSGFLLEDQSGWDRKILRAKKSHHHKVFTHNTQETPSSVLPPQNHPLDLEDAEIFSRAVEGVQSLSASGRHVPATRQVPNPPSPREPSFRELVENKLEFAVYFSEEYLEGHVVGLDELILNRLRSGDFSPEANLDLHGLNAMQAFENLRSFIRSTWLRGLRVVLLVPGRGKNSPNGLGILREKLQVWLTQEPFKRVVLAFCTAKAKDGGPGSIYVLLRSQRKKGRIYWDRLPADPDLF